MPKSKSQLLAKAKTLNAQLKKAKTLAEEIKITEALLEVYDALKLFDRGGKDNN